MKIRTDYVSNSSSSSFMIKKQNGITDFFNEFINLVTDLDEVVLHFSDTETTEHAYNYMIGNEIIEKSFKKKICRFDKGGNLISINISHFKNKDDESIHDIISVLQCCDKVELFLNDNFGQQACRLHQLATLAEYKGYDIDTSCMEHDQWIQMKENLT